jgi:hypothetical protein
MRINPAESWRITSANRGRVRCSQETSNQDGVIQDVYEFNPDGSKFVRPKIYPRNIAAGAFTGGIATVVHQARIHYTEEQLTVYHLTYGLDGTAQSAQKRLPHSADASGGATLESRVQARKESDFDISGGPRRDRQPARRPWDRQRLILLTAIG